LRALPQALPPTAPPSAAAPAVGPYFSWSSEMRILVLSSEARPRQQKYSEEAVSWPVSTPSHIALTLQARAAALRPQPAALDGGVASGCRQGAGGSSLALEAGCDGGAVGIFSGVGGRLQSGGGPGVGSAASSDSLLKQPGPSSAPTSHGKI
jgi:hypothetical protein